MLQLIFQFFQFANENGLKKRPETVMKRPEMLMKTD
jgi:hypothetical protein